MLREVERFGKSGERKDEGLTTRKEPNRNTGHRSPTLRNVKVVLRVLFPRSSATCLNLSHRALLAPNALYRMLRVISHSQMMHRRLPCTHHILSLEFVLIGTPYSLVRSINNSICRHKRLSVSAIGPLYLSLTRDVLVD